MTPESLYLLFMRLTTVPGKIMPWNELPPLIRNAWTQVLQAAQTDGRTAPPGV